MSEKTYVQIIRFIFVLNALFLVWAVLWKCGIPFIGGTERAINLIPFRGNTGWEMQFNVLLFVPFGFLLAALVRKKLLWLVIAVVSASLFLEIAQYILSVGRSDITDILLNTLGGIVGIAAYLLLTRLLGRYSRAIVTVAGVLIAVFELYASVSFTLFGVLHLGFMMVRL